MRVCFRRLLNVADPASTCRRAYWQCLRLQVGSWKREISRVGSFGLNWKALYASGHEACQRRWYSPAHASTLRLAGLRSLVRSMRMRRRHCDSICHASQSVGTPRYCQRRARACAQFHMSLGEKLSMAAGERSTYAVPAAALAAAFLLVAAEAKWAQSGQHVPLPTDEDGELSNFLKGARLQVAKARTEGKGLKLAFRAMEVAVNGSLFGGMAMIVVWWRFWLAILAAAYALPAACQYGLLQVVQVPALAIATSKNRSWLSLLRSFVLAGLVVGEYLFSMSLRNPLMVDDIKPIVVRVWPSRTLSGDVAALPLLPQQYAAQAESLRLVSAQVIFVIFLLLQVFCLLAYIIALLVDVRGACCHTPTATEHGNERGPTLARQLASDGFHAVQHKLLKLTRVQWEQQRCFDMDALKIKVGFMALDVLLDMNTIFSLLVSRTACLMLWRYDSSILELPSNRNFQFAACLTFVVARSTAKQLANLKSFRKAGPADTCSPCDDLKLVKSTLPHAICQPKGIEGLDEYGRVSSPTI